MTDIELHRPAFESWASDNGKHPRAIERLKGNYILSATALAWTAWVAAVEYLEGGEA